MAVMITEDMHSRLSRMLRSWESQNAGGGGAGRARPQVNTPAVICRILTEITTDPNRLGLYTAEEVRWEDDGLGNPTSVGWETVTGGVSFDTDNPLQEIAETEGVAVGTIVMAEQRATFFPNEVSEFKRPTLWLFQLGGGGTTTIPAVIQSKVSGNEYLCRVYENGQYTDAGVGKPFTAQNQTLFIWQVSASKEVPAGSYLMVIKVDDHYEGQVPVWL